MKGSIRQDPNGTWAWSFEYRDAEDKRHQPKGRGYKTKREAEAALRDRLRLHDRGGPVTEPSREPLGRYLAAWHETRKSRLRPSAFRREGYVVRDVTGVIGHVPLAALRAEHVEAVMTALTARGQAPASVNKSRATLSTCLDQAVRRGHLVANPVAATERLKVTRPDLRVPDAAGLVRLQQAAVGTLWWVAVLLATTLGTRRGETLGVTWECLDLDSGRIRIVRAVQRIEGKLVLTDLKTARSRRTLLVPPTALARLRAWKAEQAQAMLALGVRQTPATLICANPMGEPLDPDAFTKAHRRFAKAAGLEGARLHDSRHGVASALLAQGVHPGIASAVLGHTDPGFTLRQYSHVLDGMTDHAAEAMERALGGGR